MARTSTVIKAGTLSKAEQARIQPVEMVDLLTEARSALESAKAEARAMIESARAEAGALREAARKEGRDQGYAEGLEEGRRQGHEEALAAAREEFDRHTKQLTEACRALIDEINARRASWEASARHDLIDLALAIAARVAPAVGERERGVVRANLEEAVRLAGQRSQVTIDLNPIDAETARTFVPGLFAKQTEEQHVEIEEDETVAPGGCRISWGTGGVDATLETQLDRIGHELRHGVTNSTKTQTQAQAPGREEYFHTEKSQAEDMETDTES